MDLAALLQACGALEYARLFEEQGFDEATTAADLSALNLSEDDLKSIGVSKMKPRKALMVAIGLSSMSAPASSVSSAPTYISASHARSPMPTHPSAAPGQPATIQPDADPSVHSSYSAGGQIVPSGPTTPATTTQVAASI